MTVLLQSATGITKCDDYYKVRQNNLHILGEEGIDIFFSEGQDLVLWAWFKCYQTEAGEALTKCGLFSLIAIFRWASARMNSLKKTRHVLRLVRLI